MQTTNLKRLIDHTNLDPDATKEDIARLAQEAKLHGFNSICIRPKWLKDFGQDNRCCVVNSFPDKVYKVKTKEEVRDLIGNFSLEEKDQEFKASLENRAFEIDPVMNISKLDNLLDELAVYYEAVMSLAIAVYIKPIFSCEILTEDELEYTVAKFAEFARVSQYEKIKYCYKNSTGFIKSDNPNLLQTTSVDLVTKLNTYLDKYDPYNAVSLKVAGGVRSIEDIKHFQEICGDRLTHIGTSSAVKIFS